MLSKDDATWLPLACDKTHDNNRPNTNYELALIMDYVMVAL